MPPPPDGDRQFPAASAGRGGPGPGLPEHAGGVSELADKAREAGLGTIRTVNPAAPQGGRKPVPDVLAAASELLRAGDTAAAALADYARDKPLPETPRDPQGRLASRIEEHEQAQRAYGNAIAVSAAALYLASQMRSAPADRIPGRTALRSPGAGSLPAGPRTPGRAAAPGTGRR